MVLLSAKLLQPEIEMLQDDSMNWMIKLMHYIENILMRLSLLQPIYKARTNSRTTMLYFCVINSELLERISDHACYVGDSVHFIVTGTPGRDANCRKE